MQSRPYYVVGTPMLTAEFAKFIHEYDAALHTFHPVTTDRVRDSIGGEVVVYENYQSVEKFEKLQYGNTGCEVYEKPEFKTPIFTVYVVDADKLTRTGDGVYNTQRVNVIIQEVAVCKRSYTDAFYPNSYLSMLPPTDTYLKTEDRELLASIKALFNDYSHPKFGLFLTLHWNRHHTKLADQVRDNLPATLAEAHTYLLSQRQSLIQSSQVNPNGSFIRRMDFAISQLMKQMEPSNTARLAV